jgi:hypothetical protein
MKDLKQVAGYTVGITGVLLAFVHVQRQAFQSAFEARIFQHLVLFQDYYAFLPFVAILFAALLAPVRELGLRAAAAAGRHPWWLAAATGAALAAAARFVYHAYPLSLDEYIVLFQSKIFAAGKLTGHFPPELVPWLIPEFILGKFLKVAPGGDAASVYWPGFSLLLSPFTLLGTPWLLNPLLGAATVLVMHRLGYRLFGNAESAGLVALLTVASPAVTINAISYYSMPAHLLANALFTLLLLQPSVKSAALAGVIGSVALVLHNPVPHLFFAVPWIAWLAFQPGRERLLAALAAGYLPISLALGWGWPLFLDRLGDATAPVGVLEAFLTRLQTIRAWYYEPVAPLHALSFVKLWLWAVPALVAAAALGAWRLRAERGPWIAIIGSGLLTYVGYLCMPFGQGHGWGHRYFHSAWVVLPLLAVAAVSAHRAREEQAGAQGAGPLAGYLAGCAVLSLALLTTLRGLQTEQFISRHLTQFPVAPQSEARIVLLHPLSGYYMWDLAQNDPFLRDRVIKLVSRGPEADRAMMAKLFPSYRLLAEHPRGSLWGLK